MNEISKPQNNFFQFFEFQIPKEQQVRLFATLKFKDKEKYFKC